MEPARDRPAPMQLTVHDPVGAPESARRVRRPRAPDSLGTYECRRAWHEADGHRSAGLVFARTRGHGPGLERAVAAYSRAGEHAACWLALGLAGALASGRARRPPACLAPRRPCRRRLLRPEPGDQVRGPPAPARPRRLAAAHPGGHAPLVPERPRHDLVRRARALTGAWRRPGRCTSPPARSRSAARTSGCITRATWSPARCSEARWPSCGRAGPPCAAPQSKVGAGQFHVPPHPSFAPPSRPPAVCGLRDPPRRYILPSP